jgi:hypothetical protein
MTPPMSVAELLALPPAVDLPTAGLGGTPLALPVCFGCLSGSADACGGGDQRQGSGLLVAKGSVPR